MRCRADRKGVCQEIETLFVMQPRKEEQIRLACKLRPRLMKGIFARHGLELFQKNPIGNYPPTLVQVAGFKKVFFIGIEDMKEGGAIENAPIAENKCDLLL